MRLSILVALAKNRVIGCEGELPWRLPDELKHLKRLTMGHHLIMGRKTWDSIGRPLPGRTSIVISRGLNESPHPEALLARSLDEAIELANKAGDSEAFVFGGEAIYALALPIADRLHLTRVAVAPEGDAFFPEFDEAEWTRVEETPHAADERHAHAFVFEVWDRRTE